MVCIMNNAKAEWIIEITIKNICVLIAKKLQSSDQKRRWVAISASRQRPIL